jgi:hypothetical protein
MLHCVLPRLGDGFDVAGFKLRNLSNLNSSRSRMIFHSDNVAVDVVAASLKEFGFRQSIVVDGEGVIVCRPSVVRWRAGDVSFRILVPTTWACSASTRMNLPSCSTRCFGTS